MENSIKISRNDDGIYEATSDGLIGIGTTEEEAIKQLLIGARLALDWRLALVKILDKVERLPDSLTFLQKTIIEQEYLQYVNHNDKRNQTNTLQKVQSKIEESS